MKNLTFRKKNISNWILNIRESFDCDKKEFPIKLWEALLFIFLCFSTEILDLFSYPGTFADIFSIFPLNKSQFWFILLKGILGQIMCIYLTIRYYERQFFLSIWIFWSILTIKFALSKLENIEIIQNLAQILNLLIWTCFFVYFFAVDPCHINSLKLLLYDNLIVDPLTGKVHKTPESCISKSKLKKLGLGVLMMIGSSIALIKTADLIKTAINLLIGAKENAVVVPKNQQEIEKRSKGINALVMFIPIVIMAPIFEEWMFRRFLMKIGKFRFWTVLVSGFLFGLIHLRAPENPFLLTYYVMPGWTLGMGMYISKNIWTTIAAHAAYNMISFLRMILMF